MSSVDLGRPQSWNRYAYVENNPISMTDPDARCGPLCTVFIGGLAGAVGELWVQGTIKNADWGRVGAAAVGGARSGGLAGATLV